jgi:hypothetical protein
MSQQQPSTKVTRELPDNYAALGLPENPRFVENFLVIQDLQIDLDMEGNALRRIITAANGDLGVKGEFLKGRFAYPTGKAVKAGVATKEQVATARKQIAGIKRAVKGFKADAAAKAAAAEAEVETTEVETAEEPAA